MTICDRILELSPLPSGTLGEHLAAIRVNLAEIVGSISSNDITATISSNEVLTSSVSSKSASGVVTDVETITGTINKKIIR